MQYQTSIHSYKNKPKVLGSYATNPLEKESVEYKQFSITRNQIDKCVYILIAAVSVITFYVAISSIRPL